VMASCAGRALYVLMLWSLAACAADAGSTLPATGPTGVGNFGRPPGMPIGTGASGGVLDEPELGAPVAASPEDVTNNADLTIPKFEAAAAAAAAAARAPCAGCVELNVDVSDINQRDEFALDVDGVSVTRIIWTLLVNFNSDQLAVQPFVNEQRGKYTALHVNTFPLATPVQVEQQFKGKARVVGLVVGSSGAWTGNQTMSVFVASVSGEGAGSFSRSFAAGTEGFAPRTAAHNPKIVFHPEAVALTAAPAPAPPRP